jgi:ferritin-like metal-binding protein YciE
MAKNDSLEQVMVDELRDILDAEKQVFKALPKMARAAEADELRALFEQHRAQTTAQLERLNRVFGSIGGPPRGKKCKGMQALIEEGQEMMAEAEAGPVRDAVLIASAQKVEHYEMAAYGTLRTWASRLGHEDAAELLDETLAQEKQTDARLTMVAESLANPEAAGEVEVDGTRDRKRGSRARKASAGGRKATRRTTSGRKTAARKRAGGRSRR